LFPGHLLFHIQNKDEKDLVYKHTRCGSAYSFLHWTLYIRKGTKGIWWVCRGDASDGGSDAGTTYTGAGTHKDGWAGPHHHRGYFKDSYVKSDERTTKNGITIEDFTTKGDNSVIDENEGETGDCPGRNIFYVLPHTEQNDSSIFIHQQMKDYSEILYAAWDRFINTCEQNNCYTELLEEINGPECNTPHEKYKPNINRYKGSKNYYFRRMQYMVFTSLCKNSFTMALYPHSLRHFLSYCTTADSYTDADNMTINIQSTPGTIGFETKRSPINTERTENNYENYIPYYVDDTNAKVPDYL
jgi:hypothetical protein